MSDFKSVLEADERVCDCIRRYEQANGRQPDRVQLSSDLFLLVSEGFHLRAYGDDFFFDGIRMRIDWDTSMACELPEFSPGFDEAENVAVMEPHELLRLHLQAFERTHGCKPTMLFISDDIFCTLVGTPHMGDHEAGLDVFLFEGINMLCLDSLPLGTVYSPVSSPS